MKMKYVVFLVLTISVGCSQPKIDDLGFNSNSIIVSDQYVGKESVKFADNQIMEHVQYDDFDKWVKIHQGKATIVSITAVCNGEVYGTSSFIIVYKKDLRIKAEIESNLDDLFGPKKS